MQIETIGKLKDLVSDRCFKLDAKGKLEDMNNLAVVEAVMEEHDVDYRAIENQLAREYPRTYDGWDEWKAGMQAAQEATEEVKEYREIYQ